MSQVLVHVLFTRVPFWVPIFDTAQWAQNSWNVSGAEADMPPVMLRLMEAFRIASCVSMDCGWDTCFLAGKSI